MNPDQIANDDLLWSKLPVHKQENVQVRRYSTLSLYVVTST